MILKKVDKTELIAIAVIFAVASLVYVNTLGNSFVWDDIFLIVNNPFLKDISNLPKVLSSGYWASTGSSDGLYRPLTMATYLLEYSLFRLDPFYYHLDNIILHLSCCLFVYLIGRKLTGNVTSAFVAGILFAAHPVHTEAVAWTSGRAELLASLFFLAALYTFIKPPRTLPWYIVSPVLYFLGIASKETALTLPAAIFIYLLLFERDSRGATLKTAVKYILPYAAPLAVYMALRLHFLGHEIVPQGKDVAFTQLGITGVSTVLVMLKAFLTYIRLLILPTGLHAPRSRFSTSACCCSREL